MPDDKSRFQEVCEEKIRCEKVIYEEIRRSDPYLCAVTDLMTARSTKIWETAEYE